VNRGCEKMVSAEGSVIGRLKKSGGASLSSPQVGAIVCCQFALVRIFFVDLGAPGLA